MGRLIPGTKVEVDRNSKNAYREQLAPIISISGGLVLSQVCEITGLEPSTLQNWVKRGFVENAVQKKYTKEQISRFLIINILRQSMQLDRVIDLLRYLNGNLLEKSDDIISDSELFYYFCSLHFMMEEEQKTGSFALKRNIKIVTGDYAAANSAENVKRLENALTIMVIAYESTVARERASELMDKFVPSTKGG